MRHSDVYQAMLISGDRAESLPKRPALPTTEMGYFKLARILQIGRQIQIGAPAQPYDTAVVQHVYLGAPLDLNTLPPFYAEDFKQGAKTP